MTRHLLHQRFEREMWTWISQFELYPEGPYVDRQLPDAPGRTHELQTEEAVTLAAADWTVRDLLPLALDHFERVMPPSYQRMLGLQRHRAGIASLPALQTPQRLEAAAEATEALARNVSDFAQSFNAKEIYEPLIVLADLADAASGACMAALAGDAQRAVRCAADAARYAGTSLAEALERFVLEFTDRTSDAVRVQMRSEVVELTIAFHVRLEA